MEGWSCPSFSQSLYPSFPLVVFQGVTVGVTVGCTAGREPGRRVAVGVGVGAVSSHSKLDSLTGLTTR